MRPLVVCCDTGIDDAIALLYLAAQPEVRLMGVGSVHGNTTALQAAANSRKVLDLAGRDDVPVVVGAATPLAQPLEIATFVHGEDGLGGHGGPVEAIPPHGESTAEMIVRLARAHPGELTVLALGPATNLALAVMLEPDLPRLLRSVVVLGGALDVPGNITPWADANFAHDPEAADLVLAAGLPLTLVGLSVTQPAHVDGAWLDALAAAADPRARFATQILDFYVGFYTRMFGARIATLHDALAAALVLDPELATYEHIPVGVELARGLTRGMTLVDRRGFASSEFVASPLDRPAVAVATSVRAEDFLADLFGVLTTAPRG